MEDLQFRVEEESITKGDLEVFIILTNCVRVMDVPPHTQGGVAVDIKRPEKVEGRFTPAGGLFTRLNRINEFRRGAQ